MMRNYRKGRLPRFFCVIVALLTVLPASLSTAHAAADTVFADAPPAYVNETKIVSSATHTAALYGNSLYMWGDNSSRQFPVFTGASTAKPILLQGSKVDFVRDVAVTPKRTLFVSANNILYAHGIEPVMGTQYLAAGTEIAFDVTQVSAVGDFAVFLKKDGTVWTMGKNDKGQLGYGMDDDLIYPIKLRLSNIVKVAAGKDFALALANDGTLYGWGNNESWQLSLSSPVYGPPENEFGDAETIGYTRDSDTSTPKVITTNVKDMAAGEAHILILKNDSVLWTSGDNSQGQLGRNAATIEYPGAPTDAQSFDRMDVLMRDVVEIAAGSNHSYVRTGRGRQLVWGSNRQGQLGFPTVDIAAAPMEILQNFIAVKPTFNCSFGYTNDERLYSYGESSNNITAKNNGRSSQVPVEISNFFFRWSFMSAGTDNGYWDLTQYEPAGGISRPFITGYPDNTFKPHNSISRVEFLSMAIKALTIYDNNIYYEPATFTDINEDGWYANILSFAQEYGIVGGYSDNTFQPHATITRAEAATIVSNIVKAPAGAHNFTDITPGSWAEEPIASLCTLGILDGYDDGTFLPGNNITRAESAKVIAVAAGFSPSIAEQKTLIDGNTLNFPDVGIYAWYKPYLMRGLGNIV